MKTDFEKVYLQYREYICPAKTITEFVDNIHSHYQLEETDSSSSWQPRLCGLLNPLQQYYDVNGLGESETRADIHCYIVQFYDPRASELFQICSGNTVNLTLDEYSGFSFLTQRC